MSPIPGSRLRAGTPSSTTSTSQNSSRQPSRHTSRGASPTQMVQRSHSPVDIVAAADAALAAFDTMATEFDSRKEKPVEKFSKCSLCLLWTLPALVLLGVVAVLLVVSHSLPSFFSSQQWIPQYKPNTSSQKPFLEPLYQLRKEHLDANAKAHWQSALTARIDVLLHERSLALEEQKHDVATQRHLQKMHKHGVFFSHRMLSMDGVELRPTTDGHVAVFALRNFSVGEFLPAAHHFREYLFENCPAHQLVPFMVECRVSPRHKLSLVSDFDPNQVAHPQHQITKPLPSAVELGSAIAHERKLLPPDELFGCPARGAFSCALQSDRLLVSRQKAVHAISFDWDLFVRRETSNFNVRRFHSRHSPTDNAPHTSTVQEITPSHSESEHSTTASKSDKPESHKQWLAFRVARPIVGGDELVAWNGQQAHQHEHHQSDIDHNFGRHPAKHLVKPSTASQH